MSAKDKVNALRKRLGKMPPNVSGKKRTASGGGNTAKRAKTEATEGLDWLLQHPTMNRERFVQHHFEKKHLHISRNNKDYYKDLVPGLGSIDKLWERMESGEVEPSRLNVFRCVDKNTKETPNPPPSTYQEIRTLFEAGWSLQWLQPQHEDDSLAKLTSVLESHFGCLVGVNAYLTPPNTQGLAPHYDDVEVFVLQLSGSKHWSLHASTEEAGLPASAQTLPRFTSTDLQLELLSKAVATPKVVKGDLLYFPRGMIHFAPSIGDEVSIHLTISTYQKHCNYEVVQKAFEVAMSMMWNEDEHLRKGLPLGQMAIGANIGTVTKTVSDAIKKVSTLMAKDAAEFTDMALNTMSADFISCRHPPFLKLNEKPYVDITGAMRVVLPDPTIATYAELPPEGEDEPVIYSLLHCMKNDRDSHMLGKPPGQEDAPMEDEEEEEDEENEEESEEDSAEGANNIMIDANTKDVLVWLAQNSPKLPLACSDEAAFDWSATPSLTEALHSAKVSVSPKSEEYINILAVIGELHRLGVVWVKKP